MYRQVSDDEFDKLIQRALSELPRQHVENLDNVAITFADNPTPEQLMRNHVHPGSLLLGLYEGIPQSARLSSGYTMVLPDKITIFKDPIRIVTHDDDSFYEQIKRTLWHEIAHHYGLNHSHIRTLEQKRKPKSD